MFQFTEEESYAHIVDSSPACQWAYGTIKANEIVPYAHWHAGLLSIIGDFYVIDRQLDTFVPFPMVELILK